LGDPNKTKQAGAYLVRIHIVTVTVLDHVSSNKLPNFLHIMSATKEGIEVAKFWEDSI